MQTILFDLPFAFRQLRKSPGFTAVAILMLAFGIGATTAIFSIVEGVLLRPLPFPDSGRLMVLSDRIEGVNVIPINNPSGVMKRLTVWPHGSVLFFTSVLKI